jgi:hypothetical protein
MTERFVLLSEIKDVSGFENPSGKRKIICVFNPSRHIMV